MSIDDDKFLNMIEVGYNVDIQRTDGRIHSALISQVNPVTFSVTVEWIEKGETKGKELDIHNLVQLNPELKNLKIKNSTQKKDDEMVVDDEDDEEEEEGDDDEEEEEGDDDDVQEYENDEEKDEVEKREIKKEAVKPRRSLPAQQQHKPPKQQQHRPPKQQQHKTTSKLPLESTARQSGLKQPTFTKLSTTQPMQRNSLTPHSSKVNGRLSSVPTSLPGVASSRASRTQSCTNSNKKKKLSCVKEVEMIKQRREERRANQVLQKEAFESNFDTTALNWEFAHMIKEFKSSADLVPVTSYSEPSSPPSICVCVRKRPLNHKEDSKKEIDVITIAGEDVLLVHEPKTKVDLTRYLENHKFRFDYAFDDCADNEMVYRFTAKPLVESIFDRGMATCFAYGQTGSGKTHTMGGEFIGKGQQDCTKGIYALAAQDVFRLLHTTYKRLDLVVYASFFEIYAGKIFDLLNNKNKLRVLEDSKSRVQVCGLKEEMVTGVKEVLELLQRGSFERTSGVTSANSQSSRSHAIFQIVLKKRTSKQLHGKFSLIDLAGNERGKDTMCSERQTRMEGAEINKSLLALKECIRALGVKGSHLPFRVSQLTQVLKDSFTGKNSKTCMIAMISPGMNSCEHTLNTLRYADRVKELRVNEVSKRKPCLINNYRTVPQEAHKRTQQNQRYKGNDDGDDDYGADDDGGADDDDGGADVVTVSDDNNHYEDEDEEDDEDQFQNGDNNGDDDDDDEGQQKMDERELAMLRSNNGDEVSEDVLNYDRALFNLHQKEDEVITAYQQVIKDQEEWIKLDGVLLRMTEKPDYDVEDFSNGVKEFIDKKIDRLNAFKGMVEGFVDVIQYEESLGQNIKQ